MAFNPLSSDLAMLWDIIALVISFVLVMAVVQVNGILQKKKMLSTIVTRKLVHILVGPVFMLTWVLYSGEWFSRFFAAVVPLMFVLLFFSIGKGIMKNESFVASMSRSGEASELLKGTLYYAAIILIATLLWFYIPFEGLASATPNALIVIGCLAGGDGFADIIGRKFGKRKYRFGGSEKSMEGSIGMFLGSLLFCLLLVTLIGLEVSAWNIATFIVPLVIISFIAMVIEAISPKNLDNWTITISVALMLLVMNMVAPDFWPFPLFGGSILG